MESQPISNRATHALSYAQDTTTAAIVPIGWDNGGSVSESFALLNRNTGAMIQPSIVSGLMTGVPKWSCLAEFLGKDWRSVTNGEGSHFRASYYHPHPQGHRHLRH
jgi:hypothetical protein